MNENKLREQICVLATSIFDRGLTHGSTGNISARLDDNNILAVSYTHLTLPTKLTV